ncbi:MAG: hypothetical protein IJF32_08535 [Oscillospiraceae bacterium]|nr:hypothetical protein [Oscillospiraceae bacterium]
MKKFLSIILAAMLVIGMLPTAFAAVDTTTGAITYKFAFDTRREKDTYLETIAGVWSSYYKEYPASPADAGANWAYHGTTISTPYSESRGVLVAMTDYTATGNAAKDEWLAFRIKVPENGTYIVTAKGYQKKTFSTGADLYITPLAGELATKLAEDNTTTYGTVANGARTGASGFEYLAIPETAKLGSVSFNNGSSSVAEAELISGVEKELIAGDNVVLYHVTAEVAAPIYPSSITLTPVQQADDSKFSVTADKTEIFIGERATLSVEVADSAENPAVIYGSDSECVSIRENVVTGVAEGTATITATYTENGANYTDTVEITVKSATVTYKFYSACTDADAPSDIIERVESVESTAGIKRFTEYGTDRPWAYLGASSGNSVSDSDYIRIFNGYLGTDQVDKNNWVAFKIKVPKTATYSLSGFAYKSGVGTSELEMYIAPLTGNIKATFETASTYSSVTEGARKEGKVFTDLGISGYHVGTASINVASEDKGSYAMNINNAKKIELSADAEYVFVFNQGNELKRNITARSITLTPLSELTESEEDEKLTEAFEVTETPATDYVPATVQGLTTDGAINPVPNNDGTYTITAPETDTEKGAFLYWAKGLKLNKRIISFNNVISDYVPTENGKNYLIAVYEGDIDKDKEEYYNQDGQLITDGSKTVSMPGYGSTSSWVKYKDTNIYIANYGEEPQLGNVTVTVNGNEQTVPFGTKIVCKADETKANFLCWTKSGIGNAAEPEIVSDDTEYSFRAWENCTVTAVYEKNTKTGNKIKIITDSFAVGTETGIMAEFIGFENAVEKGIMFTATDATEATKIPMTTNGNQFTVIADKSGKYTGYAIVGNAIGDYTLITDGEYEKK